jgi:peptidoglycan/LPS O-acetylase OafA/YrhL
MFFAISGFLIARSWALESVPSRFAVKRALRLQPALVVAVAVTALIVSDLSAGSYFTSPSVYRYIGANSLLYTGGGHLPGVFAHNVYPNAVNGSLWTLPVETIAYAGVAVLGVLGALRERVMLAILTFAVLLVLSTPLVGVGSIAVSGPIGGSLSLVLYLGGLFNAGMLLYVLRDRIALRWDIAGVLMIAWIATFDTEWVQTAAMLAIPYLVLVLAYRTPRWLSAITRPGDLSYGIYVYAFPAQQVAAYAWGPRLGPATMLALVAVPVYLLAFLSWRLVEAPALRLKRRVTATAESRPALV